LVVIVAATRFVRSVGSRFLHVLSKLIVTIAVTLLSLAYAHLVQNVGSETVA
jgi:hypothetical protein